MSIIVQNCCLKPCFERKGRALVMHKLALCTGTILILIVHRNVDTSEGPSGKTFAFTAVGSKETQQVLIENNYLIVLLTKFFFLFHL